MFQERVSRLLREEGQVFMKWISVIAVCSLALGAFAQDDGRETAQRVVDAANLYKGGNVAGATKAFEDLYQAHPHDPDVLSWLGFLYVNQDRAADAVPLLTAAAADRPKDLEVLVNLGNAYLKTGQEDKALGEYKLVTDLRPKMFEAWYNIGNIYLHEKNYPQGNFRLQQRGRDKAGRSLSL